MIVQLLIKVIVCYMEYYSHLVPLTYFSLELLTAIMNFILNIMTGHEHKLYREGIVFVKT